LIPIDKGMAINGIVANVQLPPGEEFDIPLVEPTVEGWLVGRRVLEPCEAIRLLGPEGGWVGDGCGVLGLVAREGCVGGDGVDDGGLGVVVVLFGGE
jgi:hypothetical protein